MFPRLLWSWIAFTKYMKVKLPLNCHKALDFTCTNQILMLYLPISMQDLVDNRTICNGWVLSKHLNNHDSQFSEENIIFVYCSVQNLENKFSLGKHMLASVIEHKSKQFFSNIDISKRSKECLQKWCYQSYSYFLMIMDIKVQYWIG